MTQSTTHSASSPPLPSPKERRRLREAKSMSEQEVAAAVGVTKATVRAWETGRSEPRGRRREAYAKLLGIASGGRAAEETGAAADAEGHPLAGTGTGTGTGTGLPAEAGGVPLPETATGTGIRTGATAVSRVRAVAEPEAEPGAGAGAGVGLPTGAEPGTKASTPVRAVSEAGLRAQPPPGAAPEAGAEVKPVAGAPVSASTRAMPGTGPQAQPPAEAVPGAGTGAAAAETGAERAHAGDRVARPTPPERGKRPTWAEREPERPRAPGEPTPSEAFDALYAHAAPALVRQAFLLSGRRGLSHEAVERAFHIAWQNWPEVARDRDPVGWVRAAAYEFAMSPWQRLRRVHRHPDSPPLEREQRALLDALLELPPPYRRTLVLYDGLGLDLPETAAETEASTPAAANRVLHARDAIARRLPEVNSPEELHRRLAALADACPPPQPVPARSVREGSERLVWFWTRTALTVTALIIGATGFTLATAPSQYEPEVAPGQRVEGIPAHAGPQPLTDRGRELRERLLSEPAHGPGRLVPRIP
ncbi:sigma factor-like helix-turn-helix DNA-binding protein [Streptomyces amakusaensis]|uniref:Sigma factor-like helix-turn-helix DNA-binding protein n=1 Tax=Streptomyces amakusaensis TaxID=67271 RepID=A0ABW0AGG9_9ACTN